MADIASQIMPERKTMPIFTIWCHYDIEAESKGEAKVKAGTDNRRPQIEIDDVILNENNE